MNKPASAGQWTEPLGSRYFDDTTPITGARPTEIPRWQKEDIELALDATKVTWGRTGTTERSLILNRIADRMEANFDLLAAAETWDNGKPIRESRAADLPLAIDHFRYFAGAIRAQEGSIGEVDHDTWPTIPMSLSAWSPAAWKLGPALAAGNCVVSKPAGQTPVSILVWAELVADLLPAAQGYKQSGIGRRYTR